MEGEDIEDLDSENESSNHGYYRGRILRVPEWSRLYNDVQNCFSIHTVILFLIWFNEELVIFLNEPKTTLPGTTQ